MDLDLRWGADGLVVAVAQDALNGRVLMVAHMDRAAWEATLSTGQAHFHSRSRQTLWRKGETSGNVLRVREAWVDCDRDAVLLLVEPAGPACHTGERTCFFERRAGGREGPAAPELSRLEAVIDGRREASVSGSWVRTLLDGGRPAVAAKVVEEAGELASAVEGEANERVVAEAADLVFHTMVALAARGVRLDTVLVELARRSGVSGFVEKASRT